jgi:hypothetical protein
LSGQPEQGRAAAFQGAPVHDAATGSRVWSHLKRSIGNLAVHRVDQLQATIKNRLTLAPDTT